MLAILGRPNSSSSSSKSRASSSCGKSLVFVFSPKKLEYERRGAGGERLVEVLRDGRLSREGGVWGRGVLLLDMFL